MKFSASELRAAQNPAVGSPAERTYRQTRQVSYDPKNQDRGAVPDSPAPATCSALDFLAALCTHIPDAGQQLIRYYGQFSHVRPAWARATRSPALQPVPSPEAQHETAHRARRSWARLIKKVYEADPLICSRCGGPLKIISLIDNAAIIEKILRHLKLWDRPERPPPTPPSRPLRYAVDVVDFDDAGQRFDRSE